MSSPSRKGPSQALTPEFTYKPFTLARPLLPRELPRSLAGLHHTFGFEFGRRNNIHFVENQKIVSCVGNSVQILSACPSPCPRRVSAPVYFANV